ncbi:MAG TPA: acyl-CoA dehydrogenase family protein [Polyangiales bacterium]|nr:acyl-CoA dehydrogenase family protein [Polyangiales bacterium]
MANQTSVREALIERATKVANDVAAKHADDVDKRARFPVEAVEALKQAKLLGIAVPEELGGEGATLAELARIGGILAGACAATGMLYAMHQIQLLCILRHHGGQPFFTGYLRECADKQRLIASATSEIGVGGDVRSSKCCIVRDETHFTYEKQASVISYGEFTDDILGTARRAPDAAPSDQVLVLVKRDECTLERVGGWDTLGMRGTCSYGFVLKARCPLDHILPVPFADISSQTMHPSSHVLWTHVWLGIATSAVSIARKYVRSEARKNPGVTPPNALRAAELVSALHTLRGSIAGAMHEYIERYDDPDRLAGLGFAIRMNNIKISTAEQVIPIVNRAMGICGISAYRNDTPYSLGRHLRDAHGASVMILNDRLYGTNAQLLLISKED